MTDALWITPGYPWPGDPAVGIFYRTQAQALARLGRSITVLSPTPWAPWPLPLLKPRWRTHAAAPRVADDGAVRVIRPRYPNAPGEPTWAHPDQLIARAAWRSRAQWAGARLIHGHFSVTGLAAWRLAKRAGLPFILTFHGSDMNLWPDQHPERLADLRSAVREARAVIAVSAALADRVRDITGVTPVHLPLGSDHRGLRAAALSRPDARRLLGLPDDRIVVLFVGNLKATKGVRELADALLSLGDPFLGVFVGGGAEEGYGTSDPGASRFLSYVGARPHEDVVRYLSAADVLVLPSYAEGLPTVLVEAGSLGVPVIASNVGGVPELLGAGDRGTILPEISAQSIATTLTAFLADRDGAEAAAQRLGDLVVDQYDVDRNAARLIDCYRAATGESA